MLRLIKNASIRSKIVTTTFLSFVVVFVFFVLYQIPEIRKDVIDDQKKYHETLLAILAEGIAFDVLQSRYGAVHETLDIIKEKNDNWEYIKVVDGFGKQIYPFGEIQSGGSEYIFDYVLDFSGKRVCKIEIRIRDSYIEKKIFKGVISFSLVLLIYLIFMTFMFLGLLYAFLGKRLEFFVWKINNFEIQKKEEWVKDFEVSLNEKTRDELDILAQSFHQLISRLDSEVNEKLELERFSFHQSKLASLGELTASIAHEINNPLTVSTMQLSLLNKKIMKESDIEDKTRDSLSDRINKIQVANSRIQKIVKGMGAYSRLDTQDEKISVSSCLASTIELIEEIYTQLGITLSVSIPKEPIFIMGNLTKLQQVIMNLLSNGRDALLEKGEQVKKLTVSLEVISTEIVELRVQDNGCGMSDEVKAKILHPFFTTKEVGKGTGIGLGLVNNFIQDFKGEIKIESQLGVGSTFIVRLPLISSSGGQDSSKVSSRFRKVLVVDDEEDIRDIISDILVENSFEVEMASSALEALDKLKHGDFDLLLTDIEMPGIKGHELIRKVVDEFNPAPKMIIISAGISYLSKEIKDLVQGELAKPFSEKDLLNVVDSVWKL